MDFQPNLIRFPTSSTESARFSSVFPRLSIGMVLSALVVTSDGDQAVVRMRGMEINAQTQVPLRADQQVTLVVADLSREQVVFRVVSEAPTGGMTSLTDQDLRPFLVQASLPADREGFAAVRALILHGKALTPTNVTALVTAARAIGSFTQPSLDSIIFLQDRGLPVTARTVELASIVLTGRADPSAALAELERLSAGPPVTDNREGTTAEPRGAQQSVRSAGSQPVENRVPQTAARPPQSVGSQTARDAGSQVPRDAGSQTSAPSLPPNVATALQRLVALFPRLDLRGTAPPPVAVTPQPAVSESSPQPAPNESAGRPVAEPQVQARSGSLVDRNQPAEASPRSSGQTAAPSSAAQGADTSRQIARLVARIGTSLEARVANGATEAQPAEPRVLLAELQRELESAQRTATATTRGSLDSAIVATRGLSEALESSQMLNAAPQLRDESGSYFLFQLPIRTADGWETGELKIYKREAEKEIDPDNANVLLRLNMRHLGPLDAAIMVRDGVVSCDFRCERPESILLLQSDSKSLVSAIEAIGHPVRSINHQLIFAKPLVESSPSRHAGHIDTRA